MSDYTNPLFADRHIGPDSAAVTAMLEVITKASGGRCVWSALAPTPSSEPEQSISSA